jgi:serine/threonine protein kinase
MCLMAALTCRLFCEECQQPNPDPFSCYASAPNDIWSLGVILVNLTCGRNPWKRASTEDPMFRVYLKNPLSLQSILPLSGEANLILARIFQCDPLKRVTLPELRRLILDCPSFTTYFSSTPRPPLQIPENSFDPPPSPSDDSVS